MTAVHDVLQKRFAREIYFKESNDSHSVDKRIIEFIESHKVWTNHMKWWGLTGGDIIADDIFSKKTRMNGVR